MNVVVVGGGPAGLAAAVAARQRGLSVTLVERLHPPIDKVCGEGIMPEGLDLLERLGIDTATLAGLPFSGIEFIEGQIRALARFAKRPGRGVRRPALHAALVRRAEAVGVDLRWGKTMRGVTSHGVLLSDGLLPARWIVGADGLNSPVRRSLAFSEPPSVPRRVGLRRHYRIAPWADVVQVHWSSGCEAYVTPVSPDVVGVALLVGRPTPHFEQALAAFPALAKQLANAEPLNEPRGTGTAFRRSRQVVQGRVALVGDAAGSVDPITGEGLTLGLRQAHLLADCLVRDDLGAYEALYHRAMRSANGMSSFMLAIHNRRHLRHAALHTLSAMPWIFSRLLAFHTRPFPINFATPSTHAA